MSSPRQFFREQVDQYDRVHYGAERSFMSERLERMLEVVKALPLPASPRVLEAGCGPGRFLEALAAAGFQACAIDTSPQMLELAAERLTRLAPTTSAKLAVADLEKLPFPDQCFDLVCTAGVVEYLPDDQRPLAELSRVLRPGGFLVYPITNAWSPVLCLDGLVEALKRRPRVLASFNRFWTGIGRVAVRPRHFAVRTQSPARMRRLLAELALDLSHERYFHYLPLPHPFGRLFPRFSTALGVRMDWLARTPLAALAEGYLVVARKRVRAAETRS